MRRMKSPRPQSIRPPRVRGGSAAAPHVPIPRLRGALLALLLLAPLADGAAAQGSPGAERGRVLFRTFCMNCHGEAARGDGQLAELLTVPPADLTLIRARHGGEFPEREIFEIIDGRREVRGHGQREMPIWGLTFQQLGRDADQETEVERRILDLLDYLRSVQRPAPPKAKRDAEETEEPEEESP